MALDNYLNQVRRLLQNPPASTNLYANADLTSFINQARGQLAGESESIRVLGTINTAVGQRAYNFTNIILSGSSGVQGVIHVRSIMCSVASGVRWMTPRSWEWFQLYHQNNPVPQNAPPKVWSQYAQGASGSFYLDPPPDTIYTLTCDCVCYPISLASDSDPEAIPYLWTDAVQYFAAYLAYLSSQVPARVNDANRMFERYEEFVKRARTFANPGVNRYLYQQAGDPTQAAKIGLVPKVPQGGGG